MCADKSKLPLNADVQHFATTQWSVVLAAGDRQCDDAKRALTKLCESYWYPLYVYVRRRVESVDDAHDLTQAFFERMLEKNYLADADPRRGQFRVFLLTAFKHFLSKEWEKAKAQKRGGGRSPISLDFASGDSQFSIQPVGGLTGDQIYERQWAITLLSRVMQRLEGELQRAGKQAQFDLLKDLIVSTGSETSYANVASELGMTESAVRMAASRMRQRYRQFLREEIAQTVSSPEDIDDEIRQLFITFAG